MAVESNVTTNKDIIIYTHVTHLLHTLVPLSTCGFPDTWQSLHLPERSPDRTCTWQWSLLLFA